MNDFPLLPREATSVVLAINDLASKAIQDLAARLGVDCVADAVPWGAPVRPSVAQRVLDRSTKHVILVESAAADLTRTLQAAGRMVWRVYHHMYGGESGGDVRRSALEQVAQLLGEPLTTDELNIAAYDRDFLAGLATLDVPFRDARTFVERELEIQGQAANFACARQHCESTVRRLDDLQLVLAPSSLSRVMLRAAQYPDPAQYERVRGQFEAPDKLTPGTLIIYFDEESPERMVGVEYGGPAEQRAEIQTLLSNTEFAAAMDVWMGGGQIGCYLGAWLRPGHREEILDRFVGDLLPAILTAGWPLRRYECSFFLPLDLRTDADILGVTSAQVTEPLLERLPSRTGDGAHPFAELHVLSRSSTQEGSEQEYEAQAWHYMLPNLRDRVFETEATSKKGTSPQAPLREWRLKDIADWHLTILRPDRQPLSVPLARVSLYRYFNGLYLLELRLAASEFPIQRDANNWWRCLLPGSGTEQIDFQEVQRSQLDNWLWFTKVARVLYPSFSGQRKEEKVADVELNVKGTRIRSFRSELSGVEIKGDIGEEISEIVLDLLGRFFARSAEELDSTMEELKPRLNLVPDDRMFVSASYALAGPAPATTMGRERRQRLFSIALYVDRMADTFSSCAGYCYDPEFGRSEWTRQSLRRWEATGVLSGYTCYSNVYVGSSQFFSDIVAPIHVPFIYGRLLVLGLFYQASLRHYRRRLATASEQIQVRKTIERGRESLRKLRHDFIDFTNRFWFREVTAQIQGQEIFKKQAEGLDLDGEYALIKDGMERADEFLDAVFQEDVSQRSLWFGSVATLAGLIALVIGLIQVLDALVPCLGVWETLGLSAVLSVLVMLLIAWAAGPVLRIWKERRSGRSGD